jgi:V8-like Glu-specific endopeptidase
VRKLTRFSFTAVAVGLAVGVAAGGGSPAVAAPGAGAQAQAAATTGARSVGIGSTQSPEQVRAYWTKERMAQAKPPTLAQPTAEQLRQLATSPPASTKPAEVAAGASPKRSAVGTDAASSQAALASVRAGLWSPHGVMPARTIGKLYYTKDDGSGGYCTASVINADNFSSIWTAGHCVHGGSGHGWYSNFLFRPDYDNGSYVATWTWKYAATTNGWINSSNFGYDIGAIALWPNSLGRIADVVGYQGYKFNSGTYNWNIYSFGYPQDAVPARTDMNGERLFYCTGATWKVNDNQMGFHCDMFHGASGGPWLQDLQLSRGWGYIVSANSWHSFSTDEWRSPYLGDAAVNVRDLVKTK